MKDRQGQQDRPVGLDRQERKDLRDLLGGPVGRDLLEIQEKQDRLERRLKHRDLWAMEIRL